MMFKKINRMKSEHKMLFAIIIGFAVVCFWRGAWGLMDVYLFPDDYHISSWFSIFIGLGILIATHYVTKELI